tara:strand:- start:566 stop:1681 length:1116 start_codon:yes stop_codon:yes gene_type:complete
MLFKALYFLIVFQLIIQQYTGLTSVYYIIGGLLIFKELSVFDFTKKISRKLFPFLILFIYSFLLLILNLIIEFDFNKIIMFLSLFWIPVLLFLKASNGTVNLASFLKFHIIIATVGAIAGIIEFHISRDIFGLVPKVGYLELYDDFELFYRTRSIFFSTQINALFMALSFILLLEFKIINNRVIKILVLILFLYSLILTGSRTAAIIPLLYLIIKYPFKSFAFILPIFFLITSYMFVNNSYGIFELLSRQTDFITNTNEFLSGDANSSRLSKQLKVLENSNLIIGNGMGSTYSKSERYLNTESYYLQIFSELGFIGLILLLSSFISFYRYSVKKLKLIIGIAFLSGFIVHGLSSPYLLIFWLMLFNNEDTI